MIILEEMFAAPCERAGLLPEEMPVIPGIGVVPTLVDARKIAALMPPEERVDFLNRAAEVALALAPDDGRQQS